MDGQTTNRRVARGVVRGFAEHDLLTYASAICFQILTALVPMAMFGIALLGFFDLRAAWTDHLAPEVQSATSSQVFAVLDGVVRQVLSKQQLLWLTAGLVLMVWESSGGVRATMDALSRIYGGRDDRPRRQRYAISFALALVSPLLVLLAVAVVYVTPELLPGLGWAILRWPVAFAVLLLFGWLLMRFAPCHPQPAHWVSFGTVLCVGAWLITSVGFGIYVRDIAAYGSIFGSLAVVFVSFLYLYLTVCALLAGAQVDALIRAERTGSLSGARGELSGDRRPSPAAAATPRPAR